jgi:hypothetical protein
VLVKPVQSGESDGTKLWHNFTEAKKHFELPMHSEMTDGGKCESVLCQEECLEGMEGNGVHKTTIVWLYDKRPVNGPAFVYFATIRINPDSLDGSPDPDRLHLWSAGLPNVLTNLIFIFRSYYARALLFAQKSEEKSLFDTIFT